MAVAESYAFAMRDDAGSTGAADRGKSQTQALLSLLGPWPPKHRRPAVRPRLVKGLLPVLPVPLEQSAP